MLVYIRIHIHKHRLYKPLCNMRLDASTCCHVRDRASHSHADEMTSEGNCSSRSRLDMTSTLSWNPAERSDAAAKSKAAGTFEGHEPAEKSHRLASCFHGSDPKPQTRKSKP